MNGKALGVSAVAVLALASPRPHFEDAMLVHRAEPILAEAAHIPMDSCVLDVARELGDGLLAAVALDERRAVERDRTTWRETAAPDDIEPFDFSHLPTRAEARANTLVFTEVTLPQSGIEFTVAADTTAWSFDPVAFEAVLDLTYDYRDEANPLLNATYACHDREILDNRALAGLSIVTEILGVGDNYLVNDEQLNSYMASREIGPAGVRRIIGTWVASGNLIIIAPFENTPEGVEARANKTAFHEFMHGLQDATDTETNSAKKKEDVAYTFADAAAQVMTATGIYPFRLVTPTEVAHTDQ